MSVSTILTMLSIGVGSAVGEKVLNAFGKSDMASFINIAGLTGLGATAVYFIVDLIGKLGELL
ncbi:hypothetical protein [uncultured Clostridium sp.]|uniref:hypothetical protein n=1 Tax=uncultured Clostridium sp. TaxID=59620 RepID=UPI002730A437|nr:hypothetical protein [uncultured Clostridium sp.]